MAFVNTQFALPSVSDAAGRVALMRTPGICPTSLVKRGVQRTPIGKSVTIRRATRATKVIAFPARMNGIWDDIVGGIKGAAGGFATGGPVGLAVGAGVGVASAAAAGAKNKAAAQQAAQQQQQQLGPLANISTGVIVASMLGFSALLLVLAGRR